MFGKSKGKGEGKFGKLKGNSDTVIGIKSEAEDDDKGNPKAMADVTSDDDEDDLNIPAWAMGTPTAPP
eukprot:7932267-Alexandrium_andersonii.AAC.1